MFQKSSIAYAIILILVSNIIHLTFQVSLPEAMTAGMAITIGIYSYTSWSFLSYAYNRLCHTFDHQMSRDDLLSRIAVLILFMSWAPALLVAIFQVTVFIQDKPWLAFIYGTILVLVASRKTLLYEEYLTALESGQLTGLKPQ